MKRALACLLTCAALTLAACGNDPVTSDLTEPIKLVRDAAKARMDRGNAPTLASLNPAALGVLRQALETDGQPILMVVSKTLKFAGLMAPYGQNRDVTTWATEQYVTLSTRDGMMVATRGFGPDLMSSAGPTTAQVARGQGSTTRRYYYLDGADQTQSYAYDCTLARAGGETIAVLGKSYATSVIDESCSGPAGSFTNRYWFDGSHILRQSRQFLVPGVSDLTLQRVID